MKKIKKNELAKASSSKLDKPFTTKYSEYITNKIKENREIVHEYAVYAQYREVIYPFIAEVYDSILNEFYLQNNPALKNFVYNFSKRTLNYMANAFWYYFNIPLLYNTVGDDIARISERDSDGIYNIGGR